MEAREAARRDSWARETGRSVFIKRYCGRYRLICVVVSEGQRSCRDMFAEAQRMASVELKRWNKRRHWSRMARRHRVKGAHRMAVSWFYGMLKMMGRCRLEPTLKGDGFARRRPESTLSESSLRWEKRSRRGARKVRRRESSEVFWEMKNDADGRWRMSTCRVANMFIMRCNLDEVI